MKESVLLLVDDRPDNLFILRQVIAEHLPECEVVTAESANEGLKIAAEIPLDGALIDMQMPGMGGVEMCTRLKIDPLTAHIPVILITAHRIPASVRAEALNAGADDFLLKPIDNLEFIAKIRVMLRIKRAEDELRATNARLDALVAERTASLQQERDRAQRYLDVVGVMLLALDSEGNI